MTRYCADEIIYYSDNTVTWQGAEIIHEQVFESESGHYSTEMTHKIGLIVGEYLGHKKVDEGQGELADANAEEAGVGVPFLCAFDHDEAKQNYRVTSTVVSSEVSCMAKLELETSIHISHFHQHSKKLYPECKGKHEYCTISFLHSVAEDSCPAHVEQYVDETIVSQGRCEYSVVFSIVNDCRIAERKVTFSHSLVMRDLHDVDRNTCYDDYL